jgi:methyl-accepting chemotaxis protein
MRLPASVVHTGPTKTDRLRLGLRIKILIPAMALSICAALILFGWFGHKLARQSIEDLRSRLQVFSSTQAAELAEPIWAFDQMSIDRLVRSYVYNTDLLYARLYDSKGTLLAEAKGYEPTGSFEIHAARKEIVRKSGGHTYVIGRLEVVYHDRNVRNNLAKGRIADLCTLSALIALLAGATAFAIQWQIGFPLRRLRESLDRNKSCGLREPLRWSSRDELGDVVAAYNALLAEVDKQTRHLEDINANLKKENSQRRKAEEARSLLAKALDQTDDSVIITDAVGNIGYVNPAKVRDALGNGSVKISDEST